MSNTDEFLTIENQFLKECKDWKRPSVYHLSSLELRQLLERFSRFIEVRS